MNLLVSPVSLLVHIFRVERAVGVFVTADGVVAFAAVGACGLADEACEDELHAGEIGVAQGWHDF